MSERGSRISMVAAVAALVGGLGGIGHATVLSAGPFPGGYSSFGEVRCMVSNTSSKPVVVNSVALLSAGGAVLDDSGTGLTVWAGDTFTLALSSMDPNSPSSCKFDLSSSSGVHAALVYHYGTTFVVVPATK